MSVPESGPCSRAILTAFIELAKLGDRQTYFVAKHIGGYRGLDLTLKYYVTPNLRAVVNQVRKLYNDGLVDLVQDRTVSPDTTHYIAIWRKYRVPVGSLNLLPMVD